MRGTLPPASRPFDRWSRLPASFEFRGLEAAIDAIAVDPGALVVDPFVGTGRATSLLAARGDRLIGIDAHPLMGRLADLKLQRPGPPSELRDQSRKLVTLAQGHPKAGAAQSPAALHRMLHSEDLKELILLRDAVDQTDTQWQEHLRWCVLGALRGRLGPGWPYRTRSSHRLGAPSPAAEVQIRAEWMAQDISSAPRRPGGRIIVGDSRVDDAWSTIEPGSIAGCVSSPPYLNQLSYLEATRPELYFLGLAGNWREMKEFASELVASCTQEVNVQRAARAEARLESLCGIAAAVRAIIPRLERERVKRRRGKHYGHLLFAYFADLADVLERLQEALAPGGAVAWVVGDSAPYGVYVDTPQLISVLASDLGYQVLDDELLRKRGGRWAGAGGARHRRELTERLIVFRRPLLPAQLRIPGT